MPYRKLFLENELDGVAPVRRPSITVFVLPPNDKRDQAAEFGTCGAVSLPGTLDCASQDVAGDERENNRVVSQALIQNGRFTAVSNNVSVPRGNVRRIDLKGRTVIPGIIDAHNHIVLVGNRPGWHTPLEHVLTIPDAIASLGVAGLKVLKDF